MSPTPTPSPVTNVVTLFEGTSYSTVVRCDAIGADTLQFTITGTDLLLSSFFLPAWLTYSSS